MNNYSNMNYFMPNDFSYINMPIPNINNQNNLTNNLPVDKKLIEKLKKQAGNNMNFNKCNYNQKLNQNNMYDTYEGFIRGNMFPELYNQYKITKPFDINPANKQAEMLTYFDAYCFATHELNLYLDTHPNDREALQLFSDYTKQKEQLLKDYEQNYGPLFVDGSKTYPWAWNESPWPWENK